jgi:hypothetical protein
MSLAPLFSLAKGWCLAYIGAGTLRERVLKNSS